MSYQQLISLHRWTVLYEKYAIHIQAIPFSPFCPLGPSLPGSPGRPGMPCSPLGPEYAN